MIRFGGILYDVYTVYTTQEFSGGGCSDIGSDLIGDQVPCWHMPSQKPPGYIAETQALNPNLLRQI